MTKSLKSDINIFNGIKLYRFGVCPLLDACFFSIKNNNKKRNDSCYSMKTIITAPHEQYHMYSFASL